MRSISRLFVRTPWMRSALVLGGVALAVPATARAQVPEHAEGEIEGVVLDAADGQPLAGAEVNILGLRQRATTHGDGAFHLPVMIPGNFLITVGRLGYGTEAVLVTMGEESAYLTVRLSATPLEIPGLVVTGALSERESRDVLRPVAVVSGDALQRQLQSTVASTLRAEPGVSMTSMGPATARPVIRGLSGDRVLMLEDGARIGDVSNSGSDHATAIDPSSARRIEVVRGPAALLYGSSALGGVINVIRDEVPAAMPHHATGSATLQTQSVSNAYGGSAAVTIPVTANIPVRVEATGRTSQDLSTPSGSLVNTDARTWSGGLGSAYVSDWGYVGGAFRAYNNDYGIPGGFVGGHEAGVSVEMERTSSKLRTVIERGVGPFESLEFDATYTWYRHTEIEPPDILGTFFKLQTVTGDMLARHGAWGPFSSGAIGARGSWEAFEFRGSLSTPDSRRYSGAAYLYEEVDLEPVRIEAGLRYDWVKASPLEPDPSSSIGDIRDRTFDAASGSLGLLYDAGGGVTLGTSVARAFRTPDISELYSEGPHLAAYSFEVGNPSLGTEVGTGVDVFVRLTTDRASGELTAFYNDISGYVFGEETGATSSTGFPVYQFQGEDARLTGFEASLDLGLVGDLVAHGTASYVRGTLEDTEEPLPLIPPLSGRLGLEYAPASWFARAEAELAARQDRLGQFENPTDGYAVFHASAGVRITVAGRLNVVTLSAENIFDEEYRNHLSRVKEIMPQAGRGVSLTYRVVF